MKHRPSGVGWLLVLASSLLAVSPAAVSTLEASPGDGGHVRAAPVGAEHATEARFAAIVAAWTRRDAEAVVAQADPDAKGSVYLALLADPAVTGTFPKAQARQTLKSYFERIKGNPSLVDVTTAESKRAVPTTRLYDYTYRREGRDPVTTRLEVALKQVSAGWTLASISERTRPRAVAVVPGAP